MSPDRNIDPCKWAEHTDNQEMSQVSRRDYSAVVQTGLDVNSPQPNVIHHDQDYLKEATIKNDLPKRPCSLYFHFSVPNFDVQFFFRMSSGVGLTYLHCDVPRKFLKMLILLHSRLLKIVICFLRSQNISTVNLMLLLMLRFTMLLANCQMMQLNTTYPVMGSVQKIYRRTYPGYHVETGVPTVRMTIDKSLPSFLRFGRRLVRVDHEGQLPTCRKCNHPGHVAKDCTEKICFNCEEHGHEAPDCVHALRCSICKTPGHWGHNWKYSWIPHRDAPVAERPRCKILNLCLLLLMTFVNLLLHNFSLDPPLSLLLDLPHLQLPSLLCNTWMMMTMMMMTWMKLLNLM